MKHEPGDLPMILFTFLPSEGREKIMDKYKVVLATAVVHPSTPNYEGWEF
jgi:hypothetical protein